MRVVMVNNFAHVTGGADRHCFGLMDLLRGRGHEVILLATASQRPVETAGEFIPCSVTRETRDRLPARRRAEIARKAVWNHDAARAMDHLIRSFRPDVVHAHKLYPQLSVAPVAVASRRGVPVVQTMHDYEFVSASALEPRARWIDRRETRPSYRLLNSLLYPIRRFVHGERVREWIAISEFVARAHRAVGIDGRVVKNFSLIDPERRTLPFEQRSGAVYAGRLSSEKGIEDVIAIAESAPFEVTVAGAGPLEEQVRAHARRLSNLRFAGFLDGAELADLLARSRVALVPSRWQEPAGMAAVEAMAVGTPVCGYDVGGLGSYIQAGGRVVPADERDLAAACEELVGDRGEWQRRSDLASAIVARDHSPEGYAAQIELVYGAAVAGSPTG